MNAFVATSVLPSLTFLSGMIPKPSIISSSSGGRKKSERDRDEARRVAECYGLEGGKDARQKLTEKCVKRLFAEETKGASEEARLCLKTDSSSSSRSSLWGVCEDYAVFVKNLALMLRGGLGGGGDQQQSRENRFLHVRAFFAENNSLVGKDGKRYFDSCWKDQSQGEGERGGGSASASASGSGSSSIAEVISYESAEVPATDHDSVGLPENEVIGMVFEEAKKAAGWGDVKLA